MVFLQSEEIKDKKLRYKTNHKPKKARLLVPKLLDLSLYCVR